MRPTRAASVLVTAAAVAAVGIGAPADAASGARHFANCTAMHKVYKHGVSKSSAAANKQVRAGYGRPKVSAALYSANSGSDRDKDGTACEA